MRTPATWLSPARRLSENRVCDISSEAGPCGLVDHRVLAGEDAAERSLGGGGLEARETAGHIRESRRVGSHGQVNARPEEPCQHRRSGLAHGRVRAGIGGVECGRRERVPRRVGGVHRRVAGRAGLDRGDRAPQRVGVLRLIQGDDAVGHSDVEIREHV